MNTYLTLNASSHDWNVLKCIVFLMHLFPYVQLARVTRGVRGCQSVFGRSAKSSLFRSSAGLFLCIGKIQKCSNPELFELFVFLFFSFDFVFSVWVLGFSVRVSVSIWQVSSISPSLWSPYVINHRALLVVFCLCCLRDSKRHVMQTRQSVKKICQHVQNVVFSVETCCVFRLFLFVRFVHFSFLFASFCVFVVTATGWWWWYFDSRVWGFGWRHSMVPMGRRKVGKVEEEVKIRSEKTGRSENRQVLPRFYVKLFRFAKKTSEKFSFFPLRKPPDETKRL